MAALFTCICLAAQAQPSRPKILGVAHYAIRVSDLAKARDYYEKFLGFQEAFTAPKAEGSAGIVYVKVNDRQWLELINEPSHGVDRLDNLGLYTDDVEQMRQYLASHGVKVPDHVMRDPAGDKMISVVDPDGFNIEFIQYLPDSLTGKDRGKHMPMTRISNEIGHEGILVRNLDAALKFYEDILACRESWRWAPPNRKTAQLVNMDVPDGDEHVAFMIYDKLPAPDKMGTELHFCLIVPNLIRAVAILHDRAAEIGYSRAFDVGHGYDGNYEANLWDPDGTRTELMEFSTGDGKPKYASNLPPFRP